MVSKIWQFTGLYILWLISSALGIVDLMALRLVIRTVAIALGAGMWTLPAIEKFAFLFLAIVCMVFIFWCEYLYRKALNISLKQLIRLFAQIAGIQIGLAVLASVLSLLIPL
jgi:hypothetical protein